MSRLGLPIKAREIKVKNGVTGTTPKPQTLFLQLKGSGDKFLITNSESFSPWGLCDDRYRHKNIFYLLCLIPPPVRYRDDLAVVAEPEALSGDCSVAC